MKNGEVHAIDDVNIVLVESGGHELLKALTDRLNWYLTEDTNPNCWKKAKTILVHGKNDNEDLKNYCSICLLSHIYKLLRK